MHDSRWSERQREMLAAMGVRLFEAPAAAGGHDSRRELPQAEAAGAAPAAAVVIRPRAATPSLPQPADARPLVASGAAVAALDWPALRAAVADCRACALCESRTQAVFGVGHEQARLMIVGEAPGEQEDRQGEPFVGPAGKLLDNMLRAIGLARDEAAPERAVFICNTLKCRPPRNRNPQPAETTRCAPYLERQIALVQPRLLLAMGRFAAQALLGSDEPIGRLRGRVHDRAGVPVIVTYHPAYLLRTLADKARAWEDLCLAAAVLEQKR
jgi:uracil-DNA glycosylase family 4